MKYTKDSENLQSFVNDNFKGIYVEPLNQSKLLEVYQHMNMANTAFKTARIERNTQIVSDIDYAPTELMPHIRKCRHVQSIQFRLKRRHVILTIHSMKPLSSIRNYVKCVFTWLHLASNYACSKCSRSLNINLYLTDHTKTLPRFGSVIGRSNVNTAYTTPCAESTDICIFREEEWFKVFIHESFHCLGLDFSGMQNTNADALIGAIFKVNADIRLFETYCETWAEIIYSMFLTFFSTKIKDNYGIMAGKLDRILETEARFSLFQCVKVLDFNNMKYSDLFMESKRRLYREDTHVLSYYIIKSLLLFNKNEFIDWCSQNNKVLLDFNKTSHNVDKFCDLIRSLSTNKDFMLSAQRMEPWFIYNKLSNTLARKTLRMTAFELEN
jgi:hypothetical protein